MVADDRLQPCERPFARLLAVVSNCIKLCFGMYNPTSVAIS